MMKKTLTEIKEILLRISHTYGSSRLEYISKLQDIIWNDTSITDINLLAELSEFSSDLNFYEPDIRDRSEENGYYGDAKLNLLLASMSDKVNSALHS